MDRVRSLPLLFPDEPTDVIPAPVPEQSQIAAPEPPSPVIPDAPLPDDPVAAALTRGATIVTANQRTARTLRQNYDRRQQATGRTSWQPPAIFAWDAWTSTLWRRLLLDGHATQLLLSPPQEHQVWRSCIAADAASAATWSSLETVDALATLTADAWSLVCAYCAHPRLRSSALNENTEDTRSFLRWAQAFRRRCQSDAYLSQAELEETLLLAVQEGNLTLDSRELLLVGFDKMPPAQTALIATLRDAGIAIATWSPEHAATLHLVAAEDADAELRAAAHWIRQFLLDAPQNSTSERCQIAVILPSAASERSEIDRVFREILAPELLPISAGIAAPPYEFSLGQPLGRVPMIATALDLLRWARRTGTYQAALPLETVSRLLLSPCLLSDPAERGPRAEFDAFELRRAPLLRPELTLDALIDRAERSRRTARLPGLLRQLRSLRRTSASIFSGSTQRSFTDWADAIRELLQSANWAPSSRTEDSLAFQTRRKWESVLDQLSTLDFEGVRATFPEVLNALKTLLANTLFAPESSGAPVQIMGPLEAAGSDFDAVWFLRAGDLAWPARSSINPLLGWPLQRAFAMPGADLAIDRQLAHRVTQRIAASAPIVVFSYAHETAESPQRPSTLLSGLTLQPLEVQSEEDSNQPGIQLEAADDDVRIPLANPAVRGGASVLKSQAACGFRAFAERRLWSTELEIAEPGMDARERGDLVHLTLEHFWEDISTQANLKAMPPEARAEALSRAIDHALSHALAKTTATNTSSGSAWDTAYVETQRERLRRLLTPWIEQELARPLPFTVKLREEAMEVAVGPLRLKLRIDRVDHIEAGDSDDEDPTDQTATGDVLIDYKTGLASHKDWLTDRPDEPQLPLYAMISDAPLAAVAFARIRPGKEMGLDGFAAPHIISNGILPKPAPLRFETLDDQVEEWRRILTQLAEDFHSGDARVHPKSYPKTCQHCAQRLLCRLDPASLNNLADPEEHDHAEPHETEESHA
jgi:ATP-dependent helicase/nuclease subunit B